MRSLELTMLSRGSWLPDAVMNVELSDDLYNITNGLHVSWRSLTSVVVLIVYYLSRSYVVLSRCTIMNNTSYTGRRPETLILPQI